MRYFILIFLLIETFDFTFAQEKYLIYFKDKGESDLSYFKKSQIEQKLFKSFSQRAIERRKKVFGDEIFSYGDYPIYEPYIFALSSYGIQVINQLNWFNAVSCYLTEEQKKLVSTFPFVKKSRKSQSI